MEQVVKNAICEIIAEKKRARNPLAYAVFIEVSHRTGLPVARVEQIAHELAEVKIGRTLNHEYYVASM